jgi:hypothetical protein
MRIPVVARKEYPPFLEWIAFWATVWYGDVGDGEGRAFVRARNASVMNVEKDVKLPQNPVANPIYSG